MAKIAKKDPTKKAAGKKATPKKLAAASKKPATAKKAGAASKKKAAKIAPAPVETRVPPPLSIGASSEVLDRLWHVIMSRRDANPAVSHSARLLSCGTAKIAQKFGEEAVECVIEAASGTRHGLIAESADVLYHLLVMWVDAGLRPEEIWHELARREGISGIAEKASRARALPIKIGIKTTKIP